MAKAQKIREDAQQYFTKGKWDKALESYKQLLKIEPQDPKHYQRVAELQIKLDQKKDAVESYKQAVDKFMSKGFLIQAIAICKIIVQMAPEEKEVEERLATLYAKRGMGGEVPAEPAPPPRRPAAPPQTPRPQPEARPAAAPASRPEPRPQPKAARAPAPIPPPKIERKPKAEESISLEPEQADESGGELEIERTSYESKKAAPAGKPTPMASDQDEEALPEIPAEQAEPKTAPAKSVPAVEIKDEPLDIGMIQTDLSETPPAAKVEGGIKLEEGGAIEIEPTSQMEPAPAAQTEGGIKLEEEKPGEEEIVIEETVQPASTPPPKDAISLDASPEIKEEITGNVMDVAAGAAETGSDEGIEIDVMGDEGADIEPTKVAAADAKVGKKPAMPKVFDLSAEMESDIDTSEVIEEELEEIQPETPSGKPVIIESDIEEATFFPEIPLFSDLSQEEFKEVVRKLRSHSFKKGDQVIVEGEPGDSIFIVGSGRVEVFKGVKKRGQVLLATLREGEFFGEFGYFAGSKRQASVTAAEETELLEITRADMEDVVSRFPHVEAVLEKFYRDRVIENLMATSSLFLELKAEQRAKVASIFRLEEFREGTNIVKEGDEGDKIYLIRSGNVTVHAQNPMGEKIILAELAPGDFFGEISLLLGKPRTATVTASNPVTEVMSLNKEDLDALIEQFPSIGERLKKVIESRTEDTVNKVSFLDLDEEELEIGSLI